MPFKMKRRRRNKKSSNTKAVATKALRIAKSVKQQVEKKYLDILLNGKIDANQVNNIYFLNPVTQGPDGQQRDGYDYVLRSVQFSMHLVYNQLTRYRYVLVLDRDPQGLAVTWGAMLQSVSASHIFNAPRNLQESKRFKILWDHSGIYDPAIMKSKMHKKYFKLGNKCKTTGVAGTIAQQVTNSLFLLLLCDQTVLGNQPDFHLYTRVRFEG